MTASGGAWERQGRRIADVCAAQLPVLTGVYVHGSAAQGGFTHASDLDVLMVGEGATNWPDFGRLLLSTAIDVPLELSVVAPSDAADPAPPWPFLLHVASPTKVVLPGPGGDPDLCAHYAVTRRAGIPILGAPAGQAVGRIPHGVLLTHLHDELTWGRDHADKRYAVLNACRANAYATDGVMLSKIDGGRWWTRASRPRPTCPRSSHRTGRRPRPRTVHTACPGLRRASSTSTDRTVRIPDRCLVSWQLRLAISKDFRGGVFSLWVCL